MNKDITPQGTVHDIDDALAKGLDPNADLDVKDENPTRSQAAITLKLAGASYATIAEELGYASPVHARRAIERRLADVSDKPETREQMRQIAYKRIERLLQAHMGRALNHKDPEQLAYSSRVISLLDREARLMGLDAPAQTVLYTPSLSEIEKFVAKFAVMAQSDQQVREADIFDAEVVEDGE